MNKQEINIGDRVVVSKFGHPLFPVEFTGTVENEFHSQNSSGQPVKCMRDVRSDDDGQLYRVDVAHCSKIIAEPECNAPGFRKNGLELVPGDGVICATIRGDDGEAVATVDFDAQRRDELIESLSRVGRATFNDNTHTPDQRLIRGRMAALTDLLLRKNRDYGSSFREPGTLSAADPTDKLIVRIEDKLMRFKTLYGARGPSVASEPLVDTVNDLVGYFVLLGILIAERAPKGSPQAHIPLSGRADVVVLDEVARWPDSIPSYKIGDNSE